MFGFALFFKAKREAGWLESYLFCIWLTLSRHVTLYKSKILTAKLCLPKRNILINIAHIFKFKMNTTLVSWTYIGFIKTIHIEITSGYREIKLRVCFEEHWKILGDFALKSIELMEVWWGYFGDVWERDKHFKTQKLMELRKIYLAIFWRLNERG